MAQKSRSSFWIPGGVLLLIACVLAAPLQSLVSHHVHSDLAQSVVSAGTWVLRAVALAGLVCIAIGLVLPVLRRSAQNKKGEHESLSG